MNMLSGYLYPIHRDFKMKLRFIFLQSVLGKKGVFPNAILVFYVYLFDSFV